MRKSERESNVELLRIICMCLIIAHHFVLHGGLVNQTESANWIIAIIFYPGGKICFDTFLIISYWYLCEQRFRAKRFFSVYLLTLFYSVMVGGIAFGIYNVEHTSYDVLSVFLPITGNVHGFASAYLVVYALLPFYNYIQYKISKRQHIYIIGVFFLTNCFSYWVFDLVDHVQKITSNVAFFTLFYFLCAYFRKYGIGVFGKIYFDIMLFLVGWIAMASLYAYVKLNPNSFWMKYLLSINQGHTGIIPISSGIALFFIFKNLKIKHVNVNEKVYHSLTN